jgi:hypothetical protein
VLLTIPPRLIHAVRNVAAAVVVLADLGLELLCDEHDHDGALHQLGGAA